MNAVVSYEVTKPQRSDKNKCATCYFALPNRKPHEHRRLAYRYEVKM